MAFDTSAAYSAPIDYEKHPYLNTRCNLFLEQRYMITVEHVARSERDETALSLVLIEDYEEKHPFTHPFDIVHLNAPAPVVRYWRLFEPEDKYVVDHMLDAFVKGEFTAEFVITEIIASHALDME